MRTVLLCKVVTSDKFNTENEFESSMELACCSSAELADKAIEWLTDDDGWDEDDLEIIYDTIISWRGERAVTLWQPFLHDKKK